MKEIIIQVPDEVCEKDFLDAASEVGVVKVCDFIRCKDCKWFYKDEYKTLGVCELDYGGFDDWFCGSGEKRKE